MFPPCRPRANDFILRTAPVLLLLVAGAGLAATDTWLLLRFPLPSFFPGNGVAVGIREIFGERWRDDMGRLVAVCAAQAVLYALALAVVGRAPLTWARRIGLGFPVLFAALLVGMYPIYATDLLHYLASSRVYWVFHDNALMVPPSAYQMAIGIPYADLPSPYGPLWTLITAPAALIGADRPLAGVLVLKMLAAIAYLGCTLLVYLTVRRLDAPHPRRAIVAAVALAWNPFVVLRMVGHGHNDSVLLFFLLLTAYLVVSERWHGVLPALAAAVLVKYVGIVLLPPLVIYAVARSRRQGTTRPLWRLAFGGAHAAVFVLVVWTPFWEGLNSFALLRERGAMFTSTPGLLAFQLGQWPGLANPGMWGRALGLAAGFSIAVVLLIRLWHGAATPERLIGVWLLTLLALLLLATPVFRPWYMLWVAGFAVLLSGRGPLLVGVIIAATVQYADLVEQYWEFIPWVQQRFGRMLAAPVAVQFLPLAATVLVLLWRSRSLTLHTEPTTTRYVAMSKTDPVAAAGSAIAPLVKG